MAWHVFEKLLEGVANYSTFIGKLWITFFFIFRIIMVASVGDTVYNDEQSQFICNTLQPGCTNVCFNRFSPISQIRFWAVQILFVGMPSVMFIVFAMHKMSSLSLQVEDETEQRRSRGDRRSDGRHGVSYRNSRRSKKSGDSRNTSEKSVEGKGSSNHTSLPHYSDLSHDKEKALSANGFVTEKEYKKSLSHLNMKGPIPDRILPMEIIEIEKSERKRIEKKTVYNKDGKSEVVKTPSIDRAYFAQTIMTTLIESLFLVLQYHMYKFEVHELYECVGDPCPKQVDCYVSRPKEKTLFLIFMYVMTSLSIFINVIELMHLIKKYLCGSQTHQGHLAKRLMMRHNGYMTDHPAGRDIRRRRRHTSRYSAYPDLGPFPRNHSNSFSDSDGNSMDSDYRYYVK